MASLSGKVLFITGASRGIGKEIALKAAKDGASIVIAAKTTTPHPQLPGTIYQTAEKVIALGGKALPVAVDVRDDSQVAHAIQMAIDTFGQIDILVNNASSIYLTNTLTTTAKHFDLMQDVNGLGSFITAKLCYPYLKKSANPHILHICPPLQLNPQWFKDYLAYSLSKYTQSMLVSGMAAEFASDGIAVNALWPKTLINTSALPGLFKSPSLVEEIRRHTRNPSIMADAAHHILTLPSRQSTGAFFIDEDVLRTAGVHDFTPYAVVPGAVLQPDYYIE